MIVWSCSKHGSAEGGCAQLWVVARLCVCRVGVVVVLCMGVACDGDAMSHPHTYSLPMECHAEYAAITLLRRSTPLSQLRWWPS